MILQLACQIPFLDILIVSRHTAIHQVLYSVWSDCLVNRLIVNVNLDWAFKRTAAIIVAFDKFF